MISPLLHPKFVACGNPAVPAASPVQQRQVALDWKIDETFKSKLAVKLGFADGREGKRR